MKELTLKQEAILTYVKNFISDNGYAPIPSDIKTFFGYASENAAIEHLNAIEKKGYIKRTPKIARSIVVLKI